jgi:hypothetical protein
MTTPTMPEIEELTRRVIAEMQQSPSLTGGPCHWCGLGETRADRGWSNSQTLGIVCARCHDWIADCPAEQRRDLAAAVLIGISEPHIRRAPRGLADDLGLILWSELQIADANEQPWSHLDIAAMRDEFSRLAPGRYSRPSRWNKQRTVKW